MRTKQYTEAGLSRVPCVRCGRPSTEQFNVSMCAVGNKIRWVGLCAGHDVEFNATVLQYFRYPDAETLMREYKIEKGLL